MLNVAAVVVFYNPDEVVLENLVTYVNQVNKIFIIDNSDKQENKFILSKILPTANIDYFWNQNNLGVAAALNKGAQKAIAEGFDYILTMDQDSKASNFMVKNLRELMDSSAEIGIAAAEHINLETHTQPKTKKSYEILYTMTSGNLVNLSAYKKIGGYREDLFIDHVDHEFCLRLHINGFKVVKTSNALVYHKLGKSLRKRFINYYFFPSNHPPLRLYYRTRNRFFVDKLYKQLLPNYVKEDRKNMFYELLAIVIYEKHRIDKIKMMVKGYLDYRRKKMGKYG